MKKYIILLFICTLFLAGCGEKPKNGTLTLKEGTYYDKNNMHNGESLEWIILSDTKNVERTTCGADAGCSLFKGTYEIDRNTLIINLTNYNDEVDGWTELENEEKLEYTITEDNTFKKDKSVFVLKEVVTNEYNIDLKEENEKHEFGKLSLEFIGSTYSECGEDCYLYTLNMKYDGKEVGKGFFNDEENYRVFSSNMAAHFKIHQIDDVYIVVSSIASQCYGKNILIFNTAGETLEMYSNADIRIEGKNIHIDIATSNSCMEDGQIMHDFEVSGTKLKEK